MRVRESFPSYGNLTFHIPFTSHSSIGHRRQPNPPRGFGLQEPTMHGQPMGYTIFFDNLPKNMNTLWLNQLFKNDGLFLDTFVPHKMRQGKDVRFVFVRFQNRREDEQAIKRNANLVLKGRKLAV